MSKIVTTLVIIFIAVVAGHQVNVGNYGMAVRDALPIVGIVGLEIADAIRDRR